MSDDKPDPSTLKSCTVRSIQMKPDRRVEISLDCSGSGSGSGQPIDIGSVAVPSDQRLVCKLRRGRARKKREIKKPEIKKPE